MTVVVRCALTDQPISLTEHEELVGITPPAPSSASPGWCVTTTVAAT